MTTELVATPNGLVVGPAAEDRTEWLAARKHGIGGSDAAAIAGLNPWRSPIEVYLDKITPEQTDDNTNERMEWGTRLEPVVADHFAAINTFDITVPPPMIVSADHPFMFANVDRFVGDDEILEVKTTGAHMADEWETGPPDHYVVQVQHYLAVVGRARAHVAVLIGGQEYRQFIVERDDTLIASLIKIEGEFWQQVVDRTPPAAGSTESATRALRAIYLHAEPESSIELPDTATELVAALQHATETRKATEAEERRLSNQIKQLIGTHEVATIGGQKIAKWSRWTQSGLDTTRLKEDHPDLAAEYATSSTRDRLTLTKAKR